MRAKLATQWRYNGVMRLAWLSLLAACSFSNTASPPGDAAISHVVGFESAASVEDEASGLVMVPVRLDAPAAAEVRVDFTVKDGSAKRNEDYTATDGTLTFGIGDTVQYVPVMIVADGVEEGDETINLRLKNVRGGTLGIDEHTLGINSDILPRVRFTQLMSSGPESDNAAQLVLELDTAAANEVRVDYVLTGTATSADYNLAAGTVVFPAGVTQKMLDVAPIDDLLDEDPENVVVTLTNPTDVIIKPNEGIRTHQLDDNDATPTIRFTTASSQVTEGTATVTLTVQLSAVSGRMVTVPFTGVAANTNGASPADYSLPASPLTIPAGTQMMDIVVTIVDDTLDEFVESVSIALGTPTNADLAAMQTSYALSINDNDAPPSVMWDPAETDGMGTEAMQAKYKIVLSTASGKSITVPINFSGTASDTGLVDYTVAGVPVMFAPGDTTKMVTIDPVNDVLIEGSETVIMDIPSNGSLTDVTRGSPSQRTHTITD